MGEDFWHRGNSHIPRIGRMMGEKYDVGGAEFLRQRVVTYAEYEFVFPHLTSTLRGAGCYENGESYASRWLVSVQPPFCPYADRGTCSEFRMLSSFCDAIAGADPVGVADSRTRGRIGGFVNALVSGPCCVSCVGAFAQFGLLFPSIIVKVA